MTKSKAFLTGLCLVSLFAWVGCGKKCQQKPDKAFESITSTTWRLVETTSTDKRFQKLDKYNFENWKFELNGTGSVFKVVNNAQGNDPYLTLTYIVDPDASNLEVTFKTPTTAAKATNQGATLNYSYHLGTELELTDSKGNYYRFVNYTGVVAPDNTCEF